MLVRIRRLSLGLAGDVRTVGSGVQEPRIDHGPGYRVYFVRSDRSAVTLLVGGTRKTRARDIEAAHKLAANIREASE